MSGTKRKKTRDDSDQSAKKREMVAVDTVVSRYVDVDRSSERRKGGPKRDPLVDEVAVLCYRKGDPNEILYRRCAGAQNGCEQIWKDAANYKSRYFTHASSCRYITSELRQRVNASFGKRSLGSTFSKESVSNADTEAIS